MNDRRHDIALFRYSLICEAADAQLSHAERGELVRLLASRDHVTPGGHHVRVSRSTLDRWIRSWRRGGFDVLLPPPRALQPRTATELLALAEALRREAPRRTAAQIATIIFAQHGHGPGERTRQRHFARCSLHRGGSAPRVAYGRFEAEHANDRWTGDAPHGPAVGGRKTYLFAFIDDHSRALTGYRWGLSEDTVRLEAALHSGLAARGVPRSLYLDNGSAMVSKQLLRACACLGIRLVHSTPHRPQGRGKIECFFRTVRDQFLVEIEQRGCASITELNRLFVAWVETVYHRTVNAETSAAPIDRFLAGGAPSQPTPAALHEAFLWSERRHVTRIATVSLHGSVFEVDAALVGQTVELVFDPFDLARIEIRYQGRSMGMAVSHHIGRHSRHPLARLEEPPLAPPPASTTWASSPPATTRPPAARSVTPACPPPPITRSSSHGHRTPPGPLGLHPYAFWPEPRPRLPEISPDRQLSTAEAGATR